MNTTQSAVRITHLPTGLVVSCQDEKSQLKNKDKAMRVLRSRLMDKYLAEQEAEVAQARKSQVGSGDRSERIRTYNFPQNRVTDHRISLTLHKLDLVLAGDLDEIIDQLIASARAEQLRETGSKYTMTGPTIEEALRGASFCLKKAGVENARDEAEYLLSWVSGKGRLDLFLNRDADLPATAAAVYDHTVRRRCLGEPIAYITGVKEFYGLEFIVNRHVLIPRPETEGIVEAAVRWSRQYDGRGREVSKP